MLPKRELVLSPERRCTRFAVRSAVLIGSLSTAGASHRDAATTFAMQ